MRWTALILVGGLMVAVGCKDKHPLAVTPQEQLEKDVAIIDKYLDDNGIVAVEHESGMRWVINVEGTGEKPTSGDCVRLDYSGSLLFAAQPFESHTNVGGTMAGGSPSTGIITFITGWRIGLKECRKGGTITLYIPSGYAYGTTVQKNTDGTVLIPANSILVFEITLHNITDYNESGQYCEPWPS